MFDDQALGPQPHAATLSSEPLPRLYSTRDVCRIFNRQPRTIRAWCKEGRLTALKLGGSVFFTEQMILEAIGSERRLEDKSEPYSAL